ncbi:MAG: dihydrofolate synthase [Austwickia sp.]|nr:dihydrofolate synthase [Austwickia sp.]
MSPRRPPGPATPGDDAADRDRARLRLIERDILARAPEHQLLPTLDRIRAVTELLGSPQRDFAAIHVTGTNGKTSTVRMIESLLRHLGLTTGRFTSPHLHDIRERIGIRGAPIEVGAFLAAYDEILPAVAMVDEGAAVHGRPRVTYFELLVALAYAAFADAPVDVAVIEVGMGGSWDATNVVDGQVCVITPIGLDHQNYLGDTLTEIATEKAGILKAGARSVSGVQDIDVVEVLLDRAEQVGHRLVFEGHEFGVLTRQDAVGGQVVTLRGLGGDYSDVFLPLHGAHQGHNAAVAVAAVELFLAGDAEGPQDPGGPARLDPDVVRAAFAAVTSPGRLEAVRRSPTVFVDAAHNPSGARALAAALADSFAFTRTVGLLGILADKDARGIMEALEPVLDLVVVSASSSPRSMPVRRMAGLASEVFGADRVRAVELLPDAIEVAAALADEAGPGSAVVATGSITTAAEVRLLLGAHQDVGDAGAASSGQVFE